MDLLKLCFNQKIDKDMIIPVISNVIVLRSRDMSMSDQGMDLDLVTLLNTLNCTSSDLKLTEATRSRDI